MLACGEWNRYRRADLSGCAPPAGSKTYSIWAVCFVWMQRAEDTVTAEEWFPWGQHRIDLYKHRTRLPALKRRLKASRAPENNREGARDGVGKRLCVIRYGAMRSAMVSV